MSRDRDALRRGLRRANGNAAPNEPPSVTMERAAKYAKRRGAEGSTEQLKRKASELNRDK